MQAILPGIQLLSLCPKAKLKWENEAAVPSMIQCVSGTVILVLKERYIFVGLKGVSTIQVEPVYPQILHPRICLNVSIPIPH